MTFDQTESELPNQLALPLYTCACVCMCVCALCMCVCMCMCMYSQSTAYHDYAHPPPPTAHFLLVENLSSKWIAPTDNMRPKLHDDVHFSWVVHKGLTMQLLLTVNWNVQSCTFPSSAWSLEGLRNRMYRCDLFFMVCRQQVLGNTYIPIFWGRPATWLYSVHEIHSIPHFLVTPAQMVQPGIGQSAPCAVGNLA